MIKELRDFFSFCVKENRNKFYAALVWGVLIAVCEAMKFPAIGLILMAYFDGALTTDAILTGFLILFGAAVVETEVRGKTTMLQCHAGYTECANKRIQIAEHLRYLPMGYFNKNSLGEITNVTTNIMELLGDIATRVVMLTTQGILNTALIVLLITVFDWRIGLICLTGVALFALVNHAMRHSSERVSGRKLEDDEAVVESVLEYIQGISEVKAYHLLGSSQKKLTERIRRAAATNTEMELLINRYTPVQTIVLKLCEVAVLGASILFYLQGSMSLPVALIMMIMAFQVFGRLETMGAYSSLLHTVSMCVQRGRDILALPPMDIDGDRIRTKKEDIDVEHIDFAYESRKIINDVSLHIPQQTTVAFVGPSGGGKTTLCHLIARFWDVDSGSVRLDGRDVRDYAMDSLMDHFSFVFQNVYLFHDTVANNIRFGRPDASMVDVMAAARQACCHDFIMKLEHGYDTVISENGASLSGGERQRISIARAIMKDAPIIILDEATANVDPENEQELLQAVKALTRDKTILMIAHRLKTVRHADCIFVVDQGQIVQQGTHEELLGREGIYRRFVDSRRQAIGWKL